MRNKEEIKREMEIIKTEAKIKVKELEIELLKLELSELRGETNDEIKVSKTISNKIKTSKTKTTKTTKTSVTPIKAKDNNKFVKGMQDLLEEDEDEDFDIDEFLDNYEEKLDVKSLFSTEEATEVVEEPKKPKKPKEEVVDKKDIKALVDKLAKEFNLKDKKKFKSIANEMLDLCNDGVKLNEIEKAIKEYVKMNGLINEYVIIEELKEIKKIGIKQYVDKTKSIDEFDIDIPEQVEVVEDVTDDILSQLLNITDEEDDLFKDFNF